MEMLVKQGHKVVLLTTTNRGPLHEIVEQFGVTALDTDVNENAGKIKYITKNFFRLRSVVKKYDIEAVIAHQQIPALIAGVLKKIRPFKLIYVRHNSDVDYLINYTKAKRFNKLVNGVTPIKVAPSSAVKHTWTSIEKKSQEEIHRINYGYNFQQYESPVPEIVEEIKTKFPGTLRILTMGRLVPGKCYPKMFSVISKLVNDGINCKFLCLGDGYLKNELNDLIKQMSLQDHVFLLGVKNNIFDYIQASDVFLLLSESEASNSAVKEAALLRKPAIVCKGVGDFEDYIQNGRNSFLVDKHFP